jgi:RNA polymerase sigma-70 factor (ECF subfamily)
MATQETYELNGDWELASTAWGDKELTLSFQRGNRGAYEFIYQRYSTRVNATCQRLLSDPQDAQDAAQETFLRVYQALPRFNGRYQLGAWINRIATNVCLDHLRARRRAPSHAAPTEVLEDVGDLQPDDGPEEAMLRSAEGARVKETLDTLTPIQRTAILMRDFEGRAYSDIASTLGVSECRARVLLHRARKGFKKSWSSTWVLWFPVRMLSRLRRTTVAEQVACAATSATNAGGGPLAQCGQLLQQCGELIGHRIAPVASAAIMAGAAGSAPAIVAAPDALREPVRAAAALPGVVGTAFQALDEITGTLTVAATTSSTTVDVKLDEPEAVPPEVPPVDDVDAGTGAAPGTAPSGASGVSPAPADDAGSPPADTPTDVGPVDGVIGGDGAPVGTVESPDMSGGGTGAVGTTPEVPSDVTTEPAPTDTVGDPAASTDPEAPATDVPAEEAPADAPTDPTPTPTPEVTPTP